MGFPFHLATEGLLGPGAWSLFPLEALLTSTVLSNLQLSLLPSALQDTLCSSGTSSQVGHLDVRDSGKAPEGLQKQETGWYFPTH